MTEVRALALLTREAFRGAFKPGDEIPFAKRKGTFKVAEFTDRGMRVTSQQRKDGYLLDFEKLAIVVKDFGSIPAASAHSGVSEILKKHDLAETSTETVLYAAAKEFLIRAGLPRESRTPRDSDSITAAMNRVADEVDTRSDAFVAEVARRRLQDSEW